MAEKTTKYRLVTRSDFDGLVTAVLFKELDMVDEIKFVHPKDMQDGKVEITGRDITTNLPYVPGVFLAFDHHASESTRVGVKSDYVNAPDSPSASRVVFEYYKGEGKFDRISPAMMAAVDKADSAQFKLDDIENPGKWELLSFLTDARTGLGRFREFRISNYQLMMELIEHCRTKNIDEILALPDVAERAALYREQDAKAREQIKRVATVHKNLVVLDFRKDDVQFATNRFMVYALFPKCNISIHVMWGLKQQNTVFATGKSIFDRSSKTDIGALMLSYGGGGHTAAGTCQLANEKAEETLQALIKKINADG
jgi:nanoRNase/pAp phosphatase (c-di-AMP/oligoRNAs hydrolase)